MDNTPHVRRFRPSKMQGAKYIECVDGECRPVDGLPMTKTFLPIEMAEKLAAEGYWVEQPDGEDWSK
jgi:hypothetical protein